MTTSPPPNALLAARAEIDEIDAQMHALLMRRAGIVSRIEAAKGVTPGRSAYRPAREADMMRRLAARHHGPFPLPATEHIWREIITAFIRLQAPFTVQLGSRATSFRDLARFQFGATTPLEAHDGPDGAIAALRERAMDVALVPAGDETSAAWWQGLGMEEDPPLIVARVPFLLGAVALPSAFVVARIMPEATGQDRSLIAFDAPSDMAPDDIAMQVPGAIAIASRISAHRHHILATLPGFLDRALPLPPGARFVGSYAIPLSSE